MPANHPTRTAESQRGSFPKWKRLTGTSAFGRVFAGRNSSGNKHLVVFAVANESAVRRIGLVVGRKHGNAVRRNRLKRLLREAFRLEYAQLPDGHDYVCIPAADAEFDLPNLRRALRACAHRAVNRLRNRKGSPE